MIKEHIVRDHFASRFVRARVEVRTTFGRIDVETPDMVVEVEPFATWRHGVRQALAYAQETGKRPAVAIYGDMTAGEAARIWEQCGGLVIVYLLDHHRWVRIRSAGQVEKHRWSAPPEDLEGRGPRTPYRRWVDRKDKRTPDEMRRQAAAMMDRVWGDIR